MSTAAGVSRPAPAARSSRRTALGRPGEIVSAPISPDRERARIDLPPTTDVHRAVQRVHVETDAGRITVLLDVVPDEYEPHAILTAQDVYGEELARVKVAASFKLKAASAAAWIDSGYAKPASPG